jgi:glycosyltransferase involved in cell wall biosynthesis
VIAWDVRMIEHSGIGTYLRNILPHVVELRDEFPYEFVFIGPKTKLAQHRYLRAGGTIVDYDAPIYSVRQQFDFPRVPGVDLYHFPHYDVPLTFRRPFVVTIHDVVPLVRREFADSIVHRQGVALLVRRAVGCSRRVFVPSRWVADELAQRFPWQASKLVVVPYAPPETLHVPERTVINNMSAKYLTGGHYYLCVSLHKPHKNLEFLLRAFGQLLDHFTGPGPLPMLVLAGLRRCDEDSLRRAGMALVGEKGMRHVRLISDYLTDEELAALYAGACALVHPSLLEGFGFPVVEAQKLGTPVLVSDLPWAHDVAGEGAFYFPPSDVAALTSALARIAADADLRADLIRRGKANVARFDWKISAREVFKSYLSILQPE